jgi:GNAT superfamily N-acetyltransferase
MTFTIEQAQSCDATDIAALIGARDRYYGAAEIEPLEVRIRQVHRGLFGDPPGSSALLAWDRRRLIGLAAFSFLWPAVGPTRSLYLKELYVVQEYRLQGVGKLLMSEIIATAATHACSRVEWTTDSDNLDAQTFYEGLGVERLPSKLFYRLEGSALTEAGGARHDDSAGATSGR